MYAFRLPSFSDGESLFQRTRPFARFKEPFLPSNASNWRGTSGWASPCHKEPHYRFAALDGGKTSGKLPFLSWALMQTVSNTTLLAAANAADETQHDFDFPQREAAFFYGLFLRGHSAEELRRDIEVPPAVLLKWHRESERDPTLRDVFSRMVDYRRHVLAIFEALVDTESRPQRVQ